MEKIETSNAPGAVGPYSQAIIAGDFIFVSGQLGIDPDTKKMVEGGIVQETAQVLKNMDAILKAKNLSLNDVVKTTIFLDDLADFPEMNKIYSEFFNNDPKPARETVQAKIVLGAKVEISCIAYLKNG